MIDQNLCLLVITGHDVADSDQCRMLYRRSIVPKHCNVNQQLLASEHTNNHNAIRKQVDQSSTNITTQIYNRLDTLFGST
jgi:hypothetical protein